MTRLLTDILAAQPQHKLWLSGLIKGQPCHHTKPGSPEALGGNADLETDTIQQMKGKSGLLWNPFPISLQLELEPSNFHPKINSGLFQSKSV